MLARRFLISATVLHGLMAPGSTVLTPECGTIGRKKKYEILFALFSGIINTSYAKPKTACRSLAATWSAVGRACGPLLIGLGPPS